MLELGSNVARPEQSWRLNERHYGQLQNQKKSACVDKYGAEKVLVWRRGFDVPPPLACKNRPNAIESKIVDYQKQAPALTKRIGNILRSLYGQFQPIQDQLEYLRFKGLFDDLDNLNFACYCRGIEKLFNGGVLNEREKALVDQEKEFLSVRGESLKDAMLRMKKWFRLEYLAWKDQESVLIVTHGNWLRGVIKMLDQLSNEQVLGYNIPTASPILYELENLEVEKKMYLEEKETLKMREQMVLNQIK